MKVYSKINKHIVSNEETNMPEEIYTLTLTTSQADMMRIITAISKHAEGFESTLDKDLYYQFNNAKFPHEE